MACKEVNSGEIACGTGIYGCCDELLTCVLLGAVGACLEYLVLAYLLGDAVAFYKDVALICSEKPLGVKLL